MNQRVNITELSLVELKSLAYDVLVNIQNEQRKLAAIEAEIANKIQEAQNGVQPNEKP